MANEPQMVEIPEALQPAVKAMLAEIRRLNSEVTLLRHELGHVADLLDAEYELRVLYQTMVASVQQICDDERYDFNLEQALDLIEFIIAPSEFGGYHA